MSCALPGPRPTMNRTGRCGQVCACDSVGEVNAVTAATMAAAIKCSFDMGCSSTETGIGKYRKPGRAVNAVAPKRCDIACCFEPNRMVQSLRSRETTMPLVGAVAAPHSHLQLFTRPAENEQYKADVQKGRNAMIALR